MIAEIIAGVSGVTSLATIIWLVHGRIKAADALADARMAQGDTESHVERLQFELETATKAFNESQRRNRILSEALNVEMARASGLAPDDVAGRLRRLEVEWSVDAEDHLPAVERDGVSDEPAAGSPNAAPLPAGSATVR